MRTKMKMPYVPTQLDSNWCRDPLQAEEIRSRVRALHRQGDSQRNIAQLVGITERTVSRIVLRASDPIECGSTDTVSGDPCRILVSGAESCRMHR